MPNLGVLICLVTLFLLDDGAAEEVRSCQEAFSIDCRVMRQGYRDHGGGGGHSTYLHCGTDRIQIGDPISCQILKDNTTLLLSYIDPLRPFRISFVDTVLGWLVRKIGVTSLFINLHVETYGHVFLEQFPLFFNRLAVNIDRTKCIDFAAFLWTTFNGSSSSPRVHLLTNVSLGIDYAGGNDTAETVAELLESGAGPAASNYPLQVVTANFTDYIRVSEEGECLWKANYTHPSGAPNFVFFLRSDRRGCLEVTAVPEDLISVDRFLPEHVCFPYAEMGLMLEVHLAGVCFIVAACTFFFVGIIYFRIREGKCGCSAKEKSVKPRERHISTPAIVFKPIPIFPSKTTATASEEV